MASFFSKAFIEDRFLLSLLIKTLTLLIFFILIYQFFDLLLVGKDVLKYPYEIDYGEGCGMVFLKQLITHGTYFFDINALPFSYATYPPFFFLCAAFINLFSPSILLSMRALSFFSACVTPVVLYALIRQNTKSKTLSVIFAFSFLNIWFVREWAPLARVDMFCCFLTLLGLYIFQKNLQNNYRYLAFLCLGTAFFTKQNSLLGPGAILLYSMVNKEQRKYFFPYLGSFLIPVLAIFLFLNRWTHGEAWNHLFVYTSQRAFISLDFAVIFKNFLETMIFFLALASLFRFRREVFQSTALIYWFFLLLNFLTLPSAGVTAASSNYLIQPSIAIIIFAAIISDLWIQKSPSSEKSIRLAIILLLLLTQNFWLFLKSSDVWWLSQGVKKWGMEFGVMRDNRAMLSKIIQGEKGDVLSEDLTLLVGHNKPIFLGCSYPLAERGQWEPKGLIQDCKEGRFGTIIAGYRMREMSELFGTIQQRYKFFKKIGDYDVYKFVG
jgi:hypothetical protein